MTGILLPKNFEDRLSDAVDSFWMTRSGQLNHQHQAGTHDQGNRGAVTGGKQLDGFVQLLKDTLVLNRVPESCIFADTNLELPGYYRPNKKWDLLVVDKDCLVIAVEFKSQVGPSFGNNFNNRTEEAIGSAADIWEAYQKGSFGNSAPWLGYFMVLEDCAQSNRPVGVRSPHFPVFPEFENTSYKQRYEIFCEKLLRERLYNGACLITTSFDNQKSQYDYPSEELSLFRFIRAMIGTAISHF